MIKIEQKIKCQEEPNQTCIFPANVYVTKDTLDSIIRSL